MRVKFILGAAVVLVISFAIAWFAFDIAAPRGGPPPKLVALPPLPPPETASSLVAPITIPLAVLRDAAERNAPRQFAGKVDNPAPQLLQNADINWTAGRGAIVVAAQQDAIAIAAPLNGNVRATGTLSGNVQQALGNALGNILGGNASARLGNINIKQVNANADLRGAVTVTSRPQLLEAWRLEPNLTAQVGLADTALAISGIRLNIQNQVKPVVDRNVAEQLAMLQQRIRNDPALEIAARREWDKLCRSIPLQSAAAGTPTTGPALPALWLEMKPLRAFAAQPRVSAEALTLVLGLDAQTRITSAQTKPECPFPQTLAIVPAPPSKLSVGVPIDLPFTEIDRIVKLQLVGKTFPETNDGAVSVTVKSTSVAASGDRLLISALVKANERKSFFGFGADATIHIWGRPVLDRAQQVLKLGDIELAVESEAAFGLLGAAAQAALPYLKDALAERATIDLKPLAASALQRIDGTMAEMQKNEAGVKITANVTSLKLASIVFDSKTLRVIAEAEGAAKVDVTAIR